MQGMPTTSTSTSVPAELPFFDVIVSEKSRIARDIYGFKLARADGAALPSFTAGAHVTVVTPSGNTVSLAGVQETLGAGSARSLAVGAVK